MTTYAEIIADAILDALGPNYDPDAWQPPAASSATAASAAPGRKKAERRSKGSATK